MTRRLNYLAPNGVLVQVKMDTSLPHFDDWLDHIMTRENADMWNFFFTEDTTDIFQEDVLVDHPRPVAYIWCRANGEYFTIDPSEIVMIFDDNVPFKLKKVNK